MEFLNDVWLLIHFNFLKLLNFSIFIRELKKMMNIKEKLTCKCCNEIYNNPVTLACGDTVFKHHIEDLISNSATSNKFTCPLCNKENFNQNLDVNKVIESLLEIELHDFKMNPIYETVLDDMKKEIKHLETILKDPENYIYEQISELNLVSACCDCTIKIWNIDDGTILKDITVKSPIFSLILFQNTDLLIGCKDGTIKIVN